MPYELDPQLKEVLAPLLAQKASMPPVPVHEIGQRREEFNQMLSMVNSTSPIPADVRHTSYSTKTADGHDLQMTLFSKQGTAAATPGPAVLFCHGGGMILGSVALYSLAISKFVSATGTPFLAVEYRLAPEHPHPAPTEDCYTGLAWLRDHSAELSVNPARICIMGDSAGGGIAAGVALMARDRAFSPPLAKQILIYPMLDDRNTVADTHLAQVVSWGYDDNLTGWAALLGKDVVGTDKVSPYAAPARVSSVRGLPPTYIDVGTIDLFRDENIEYASRLLKEQISVELHLYPGLIHGVEGLAPDTDLAKIIMQNRIRAVMTI